MNKNDIPQFINKQSVEMLLQSNRVTAKKSISRPRLGRRWFG